MFTHSLFCELKLATSEQRAGPYRDWEQSCHISFVVSVSCRAQDDLFGHEFEVCEASFGVDDKKVQVDIPGTLCGLICYGPVLVSPASD
jgi:hypothetical protein